MEKCNICNSVCHNTEEHNDNLMKKENKIIKGLKEAKERIDKGEFVTEKEFFENKPLSEKIMNGWDRDVDLLDPEEVKATNKRIIERLRNVSYRSEHGGWSINLDETIEIIKEEMGKGLI